MTHLPEDRTPSRFTLVQLLILVGIIGGLLGIFGRLTNNARRDARRMSCSNNLKQIGLALQSYHDTYKTFPPNGLYFTTSQSNNPFVGSRSSRGSVLVKLLAFMESDPLYGSFDFEIAGQPWGFERQVVRVRDFGTGGYTGEKVVACREILPFYLCPSASVDPYLGRGPKAAAVSCYAPSMGSQSMPGYRGWCRDYPGNQFGTGAAPNGLTTDARSVSGVFAKGHWAARLSDIKDGQSQVIAMGEILPHRSWHQSLGWIHANAFPAATTGPVNFPVIGMGETLFPGARDCGHYQNRQTSDAFRSRHQGGAQFVMCDGSVQFISEDIDYLTYQRLGDRRDGQPLGDNWHWGDE